MSITGLDDRRVIVCCGSGGVGKTTISAGIALALANNGARVAVVTIDPARRLASTLGLETLGDDPRQVDIGTTGTPGELWALQLDAKATFDRLVHRHAPSPEAAQRILDNRIYEHLSGAVAGSQEYMAVERLNELTDDPRFDVIVLDTPPAQNALDFLDAPGRITHFIEGKSLRMLLSPGAAAGHLGWKVLHAGSSTVFSILERVTGAQLLRDLSEFLAAFDGMYTGFSERAERVRALLHSPRAAFVVVSSADDEPVREAVMLVERLTADRYPLGPAVMNRIRPRIDIEPPTREALIDAYTAAGAGHPEDLAERTLAQLTDDDARARRDHDACTRLARLLGDRAPLRVPDFADEPVEIAGLEHVADALAP
jgi:anion-transporting  ArsA/GET3 family ATPase